ncbi:MAG: transglutaminase domain-containing protein [Planctomycetaceae bacterium]|nr:transglutaminase domain-containing protein [Planctomycetaceae bacterium]
MFRFMMQLFAVAFVATVFAGHSRLLAQGEPLLKDLAPGLAVDSSTMVPAAQLPAISNKLGGQIQRLSNSMLRVHGAAIQVNVIAATDEVQAAQIFSSLKKIKSEPFIVQKGSTVVEYVGQNIDENLAQKTTYELGLKSKPKAVTYLIVAELATVEKADYMNCNVLFNHFLTLQKGNDPATDRKIRELSRGFVFGRTLALRNPALDGSNAKHEFAPKAVDTKVQTPVVQYSFRDPVLKSGVPFVTATLEIPVDGTGRRDAPNDPAALGANAFWPSDDPEIQKLAQQITKGKTTNQEKADAILLWLAPGRNLKYSGQTGSRWGTRQVLQQKFGHCWDFSDCFVTLARAAGVPSRQVAGWLFGSSGHVWAEYYQDGHGWQQVDPTGGGQVGCGIYHIPYFTANDGEMLILYGGMPKIEIRSAN